MATQLRRLGKWVGSRWWWLGVILVSAGVVLTAPAWWQSISARAAAAARDRWPAVVLLVGGMALLAVARYRKARAGRPSVPAPAQPVPGQVEELPPLRIIRWQQLAVGAVAIAVLTTVLTVFLWRHAGTDAKTQIEAVRTGLTVGFGAGGALAIAIAGRRQWLQERDHHHQQRVAQATEYDAEQRRLTELYVRAVDQLGSDKAAVRLGGVYALERLANNHPDQRQTVIDVFCAYLRMPYQLADDRLKPRSRPTARIMPAGHKRGRIVPSAAAPATEKNPDPAEERQVRHTIIRIIRDHLRPADPDKTAAPRWHGHHFDLTAAVLDGGDLSRIHVPEHTTIDFTGTTFAAGGTVTFDGATFSGGSVAFDGAKFSDGSVTFGRATFSGGTVTFDGAAFSGGSVAFFHSEFSGGTVTFDRATFSGGFLVFGGAKLSGSAVTFDQAEFAGGSVRLDFVEFSGGTVTFNGAKFFSGGRVWLDLSVFSGGTVAFETATFSGGTVTFGLAKFSGGTVTFVFAAFSGGAVTFDGAEFAGGTVTFDRATFSGGTVTFDGAAFSGGTVTFDRATFSGGTVDLSTPATWIVPPRFDAATTTNPPAGLLLPPSPSPGSTS